MLISSRYILNRSMDSFNRSTLKYLQLERKKGRSRLKDLKTSFLNETKVDFNCCSQNYDVLCGSIKNRQNIYHK